MPAASLPEQAAELIRQQSAGFTPQVGIILGSGLQQLANAIEAVSHFSYEVLPGFTPCRVTGHAGVLTLGTLQGVAVACLQGRNHYYEGYDHDVVLNPIRTLQRLGCHTLLLTCAAGSLRADIPPATMAIISDHINFQFRQPLVGLNDETYGQRFTDMGAAYDPELRRLLRMTASRLGYSLPEGVYIGVLGPSFETPAEIRAFKIWGADLVGMSTVAEVIVARHCGLRVAAIASVTNMAAGFSHETLDHIGTLQQAALVVDNLSHLLQTALPEIVQVGVTTHVSGH